MSESLLRGSCLCGAFQYRVPDAFEYALICHCSQCRRATGSAFKAFAGIKLGQLQTEERNLPLIFGDETAQDVHCKTCGSLLNSVVREQEYAHVALGTLVDNPGIRPSAHIYVGSKAPWYEITDDLPQHETLPQ